MHRTRPHVRKIGTLVQMRAVWTSGLTLQNAVILTRCCFVLSGQIANTMKKGSPRSSLEVQMESFVLRPALKYKSRDLAKA